MVIQLDRSYKISFKTEEDGAGADFSILDGFYEVVRSYGWNEMNASGINLQEMLLDQAGIVDKTTIRVLQQNWVNDAFYFCIGMDQDRQIWVPESIIKGYPDPRIGSYKKLMLTIDLGVFANAEDFSTMGKEIMNYLRSNYGIDRPDGIVAAYDTEWMTVKEFEDLDTNRKAAQGLVYSSSKTVIPCGNYLSNPFILVFDNKPKNTTVESNYRYLGKPMADRSDVNLAIGAFSDTIRISYGDEFEDIPHGDSEDETPCWYYIEKDDVNPENVDVIQENVSIETSLNGCFRGTVLSRIRLKSNFKKPFYVWKSANKPVVFTKQMTPEVQDKVYSDRTLLNEIGTVAAITDDSSGLKSITINKFTTSTSTTGNESDMPVVQETYEYYSAANQIFITVGYRSRNLKSVKYSSAYSNAIKYAYENIDLKKQISALEEELTNQAVNDSTYETPTPQNP